MKKTAIFLLILCMMAGVAGNVLANEETINLIVSTYDAEETTAMNFLYECIANFEAANPNVKLEYVSVPNSDYMTTYKTRFLGGDGPDIFFGKPRSFADLIEAGYVLDLTDYDFVNQIDPAVQKETTTNGRMYGVGLVARPKGVIYNLDMFEKYNVEIPTTYSEFIKLCDFFMDQNIYPLMHAYSYIYAPFTEHDSFFPSIALHEGEGDLLANVQAGTAKLAESKSFPKSMEIYNDLVKYQDPGDFGIDQARSYELFAAGDRPMFVYGGWIMGEVMANNPNGRFGLFSFPWSETPEDNTLVVGLDFGYMVNAQSAHVEEAVDFVRYMSSPEAGALLVKHTGLMSSVLGVEYPENSTPYIKDFSKYIAESKTAAKWMVPEMTSEYSTVYRTMLQEFASLPEADRDPAAYVVKMDEALSNID